jgi:hypothetical protein
LLFLSNRQFFDLSPFIKKYSLNLLKLSVNSSILTLLSTDRRFCFLLVQEAIPKTISSIRFFSFKHLNKSAATVVKGLLDR